MQHIYHKSKKGFILNGYQSYLKASPHWIGLEVEWCRYLDISLGLKLVRGAYMNEERQLAIENGKESPIWEDI